MAIILLAALIIVPVLEISLFIKIGSWIGLWPTVFVVIVTAAGGATMLRIQGLAVLRGAQNSMARNELPLEDVFNGLCLLVAGVLLLTPGFFTDALGFLLFVPVFRHILGKVIWQWAARHGATHVSEKTFGDDRPVGSGPVIDGDYEEVASPPPAHDRLGSDKRS